MPEFEQTIWRNQPMVELSEIPEQQPRIKLEALPPEIEAKVVGEKMKEASQGKTGGLILEFITRDGKHFTQKYSAMSGAQLKRALRALKYTNTEPLKTDFHHYVMTTFDMGYPRYLPDKRVK
jgi:hypothetical protein